jgi:hypothetical protein
MVIMIKLDVWSECDSAGIEWHDTIEVSADATDDEIEQEAKETALQHFEWGYDVIKNGDGDDD